MRFGRRRVSLWSMTLDERIRALAVQDDLWAARGRVARIKRDAEAAQQALVEAEARWQMSKRPQCKRRSLRRSFEVVVRLLQSRQCDNEGTEG